ncbi:5-amino-6-(5-phospho-D-ribitylamino)uracil phosphatase YwtE [Paenibacillus macerans]|nr:5-amino-6-(5-phospho-D-ribitylamino)uracil phosphatase YwtE [Paenibacillus macerans]
MHRPASFDAKALTGGLAIPIIGFNGAAVYNERGQLLRETPIAAAAALDAVRYLLEQQVYFEIFCPEAIYSPYGGERKLQAELDVLASANPAASRERLWKSAQIQFVQFGFQQIDDPLQLLKRGAPVYKLLVFTYDETKLDRIRKHFGGQRHLHTTSSADHTVEIISIETDKGNALRFMAEHLGVPMADTVVIGDSYNDISMFHAAGTSIAMGNAVDEIKQLSTMVTRDNNHHGVAYALNHLLEL